MVVRDKWFPSFVEHVFGFYVDDFYTLYNSSISVPGSSHQVDRLYIAGRRAVAEDGQRKRVLQKPFGGVPCRSDEPIRRIVLDFDRVKQLGRNESLAALRAVNPWGAPLSG